MPTTTRREVLPVRTGADVVLVRQAVRAWAAELGMSLIDQTKFVTAASELARNALEHGGGGEAVLEQLTDGFRKGVRATFSDTGKGIPDMNLALKDGYTTGGGLGLGLSGAKRLVDQFEIDSQPGVGTRVSISKWK